MKSKKQNKGRGYFMESKKQNKADCATCKFFNGNCTHKSNVGIKVKYRQESTFYIKKAEELKADCKNYAKA